MDLHHLQNQNLCTAINLRIPPPFSTEEFIPPSFLPEELIREILSRLPVKSLFQLKCVCKSWKTLISGSQFAQSHLQISRMTTQQLVFSVLEEPYKIASYSLEALFENSSIPVEPVNLSNMRSDKRCIIGSCNGLLCVFHKYQNTFELWNPSIRFKSNPSPEAVLNYWLIIQYGFGYDQVNDKYKVILVVRNKRAFTQNLIKIYTFGENIWKTIPNFSIRPTRKIGKFVSGTLNWMIYKSGEIVNQTMKIFSFDVEKETYRELLLPQNDDGDNVRTHCTLYILSNCLCVLEFKGVVWLMKEYGVVESWTKLMVIPPEQTLMSFVDPLFISENSVLLLKRKKSQTCPHSLSINGANRTYFVEQWLISQNGGVTVVKKSSSQLSLYNSNKGWLGPLSCIISTIGLDIHIHCESLVSLQW